MLEIRDRVLLKDGCSILSTVGARRFRVLTGGERDGYDTAQVEFLRDTPIPADQLLNVAELHNKVCAVCIHVTRDLVFFFFAWNACLYYKITRVYDWVGKPRKLRVATETFWGNENMRRYICIISI